MEPVEVSFDNYDIIKWIKEELSEEHPEYKWNQTNRRVWWDVSKDEYDPKAPMRQMMRIVASEYHQIIRIVYFCKGNGAAVGQVEYNIYDPNDFIIDIKTRIVN